MIKTTNHDEEKPTPPPSDAQIVKKFIAQGAELKEALKTESRDREFLVIQGHAEARQQLADMLESGKAARAAYVKDATERFAEAVNQAGRSVADFLNAAYKKAEERADQDQK